MPLDHVWESLPSVPNASLEKSSLYPRMPPPCPYRGGFLGLSVSPPSTPLALTTVLQPLTPHAVVHHISTFRNQPVDPTVPPAQALCWELPGTCPPQLWLLHGPRPKPCDLRSFSLVTKLLPSLPSTGRCIYHQSAMLQAISQVSASSWGLKHLYVCAQTGESVGKDPRGGWGRRLCLQPPHIPP